MARAVTSTRARSLWIRLIAVICVALTGWHIFATFLWVAPPSALRELVPAKSLSGYMLPLFGQSWSVFAPEPVNGNITIKVRAYVGPEGSGETTEWVNASAAELGMAHHNLFPPRAAIIGLEQATQYKGVFDKLTKPERKVVAGGYFAGNDWYERFQTNMELAGDGATHAQKENAKKFMQLELRTIAYSTQVSRALWGDSVSRVQFSVSRQNVVPFNERNDSNAAPQPIRTVESGWRGTYSYPGQNSRNFKEIFVDLEVLN